MAAAMVGSLAMRFMLSSNMGSQYLQGNRRKKEREQGRKARLDKGAGRIRRKGMHAKVHTAATHLLLCTPEL
jgi:hypothetical protein